MKKIIAIVNYHYIRGESPQRGIHAITMKEFENQLDVIGEEGYQFISLEDVNESIENGHMNSLPEMSCLITFDDGLKESYDNGLQILDKKGIPGAFFIIGKTLREREALAVHKFHFIRSLKEDGDLIKEIREEINLDNFQMNDALIMEQYPWDSPDGARLKYLFNFLLPGETRQQIINQLFQSASSVTEENFAAELYMTHKQVQDLSQRNYLGTHSYQHLSLASLSEDELRNDVTESMEAIYECTGEKVRSISYPYGESSAVNKDTALCCEKIGLLSGFTMYRGVNTLEDLTSNRLLLKRLDMNDMLGGKSENVYKELMHAN